MTAQPRPQDHSGFTSMVLLMGSTGSGKSHFINKLKEGATVQSDSLYSCTSSCQAVYTKIGLTNVVVVDCPGFNDTKMSDAEVLAEIASVLSTQYLLENQLRLRGILYLRDITKPRMEGSDMTTFELFSKLVGKKAFPYVVFVTTKWGLLDKKNQMVGNEREMELKEDFWKEMIMEGRGSYVTRFLDTKDSAEGIISQVIGNADPVVLKIQHELIDEDMELGDTSAGAVLAGVVEERLGATTRKIRRCRDRLEDETNATRQSNTLLEIRKADKAREQAQTDQYHLKRKVGSDMKSKIKTLGTWQETSGQLVPFWEWYFQLYCLYQDQAALSCNQ